MGSTPAAATSGQQSARPTLAGFHAVAVPGKDVIVTEKDQERTLSRCRRSGRWRRRRRRARDFEAGGCSFGRRRQTERGSWRGAREGRGFIRSGVYMGRAGLSATPPQRLSFLSFWMWDFFKKQCGLVMDHITNQFSLFFWSLFVRIYIAHQLFCI